MADPELRVGCWPILKQASVVAEMSEQLLTAEVERRLTDKHPHIPSDEVSVVIQTVCARFEHGPIRDLVPLLVERVPVRSWQSSRNQSPRCSEIETKDKRQAKGFYCSAMQLATVSW